MTTATKTKTHDSYIGFKLPEAQKVQIDALPGKRSKIIRAALDMYLESVKSN